MYKAVNKEPEDRTGGGVRNCIIKYIYIKKKKKKKKRT